MFLALGAMFSLLLLAFSAQAAVNGSDSVGAATANGSANRSTATTSAGNYLAQGGNTTQLNVTITDITDKWQGFFGETNGSLILGAGGLSFFNFGEVRTNVVIASTDSNYNLAALQNETAAGANLTSILDLVFFNTTVNDPRTERDSANRTFTGRNRIGGVSGVASATVLPATSGFYSGIFHNGSINNETASTGTAASRRNHYAFGVNVTSDVADFLTGGHTSDYELMVPVPTSGTTFGTVTYFFFMDIE